MLPLVLLGCTGHQSDTPARIDHVIVGVANLEHGMTEIETLTGVRPTLGGAHPGQGTRNALLSLGEGAYLELYAPNPAEPSASAEVDRLRALKHPTPVGWAVSAKRADALRSTMKSKGFPLTPPEPGSRRKPDGSLLTWVTYGYVDVDHPLAPFFIQWGDPAKHPSRTSPPGCVLKSLNIEDPAANELRGAIDPLAVGVAVKEGRRPAMTLKLSCPRGKVTLPPTP